MSEVISFEAASPTRGTLNLNAKAESGTYAGVYIRRDNVNGEISSEFLSSMTSRALFVSTTAPGFDVDCIFMRKVTNIHNTSDTSSMCTAFYFEFHVHKKSAINTPFVIDFGNVWFNFYAKIFSADVLKNTSLMSRGNVSSSVNLFETDPVRKARQIYDSV